MYIEAHWGLDYDSQTDKCYSMPACTICMEKECMDVPLAYQYDNIATCINCGTAHHVNKEMIKWFKDRDGEKVETDYCFGCGKNNLKMHYRKNPVSLEWVGAYGECECGCKVIV